MSSHHPAIPFSDDTHLPHGTEAVVMQELFGDYDHPYRRRPADWIRDVLGEFVWSIQEEILQAFVDHPTVAIKACHGMGKSWLAARLIAWWVCTHPPEQTLVIFTSVTYDQVWQVIGAELGQLWAAAERRGKKLPGRLLNRNTEWFIGGHLVANGLKPEDNNDNAFQGRHRRYTLVIGDEADGIPPTIYTGMDAVSTTEDARQGLFGNPMDNSSQFATACGDNVNEDVAKKWDYVRSVSVFETPNLTGEVVPEHVAKNLVSVDWVEKRRKRWGEGSMMWTGRVLGRFPKSSQEKLIAPAWIAAAAKRDLSSREHEIGRFAMDVARFGDSETAIARNRGGVLRIIDSAFSSSGPEVKRMARTAMDAASLQAAMNIDGDGVGGPIYDDLHEEEYPVFEFRGGTTPDDPEHFVNRRSEAYWTLREMFRKSQVDIDPEDKVLIAQLSNIKWKLKNGKVAVETKEEMRKRGVPSPDRADVIMMAAVHLGDSEYGLQMRADKLKGTEVEGAGITAGMLDEAF